MINFNRFFTCSKCSRVDYESNAQYLDNVPVCHPCCVELRFGEFERQCAARGYHVTRSQHCALGDAGNRGDSLLSHAELICECNARARFVLESPIKWDGDFIFDIPMRYHTFPEYPKRWFLLEGKATALPDDEMEMAKEQR